MHTKVRTHSHTHTRTLPARTTFYYADVLGTCTLRTRRTQPSTTTLSYLSSVLTPGNSRNHVELFAVLSRSVSVALHDIEPISEGHLLSFSAHLV